MSLALYWGSGSPYSWRCQLVLALKQLPYASHRLEFSKGEHKSPEMLARNPRGKVPVLTDGDVTIYESLAIATYLDAKFPRPALFGESPLEIAAVWRSISEHDAYLVPAALPILHALLGRPQADDALTKAGDTLRVELTRLDDALAKRPWLAGERVTAADIWLYPSIMLYDRVIARQSPGVEIVRDWRDRYPALASWQTRMAALPGVDETYPPHWRDS